MALSNYESPYLPFELLIGAPTPGGYPVTIVDSPAGDGETLCALRVDAELRDALAALETGAIDQAFLIELGSFFFNELFTGDVVTLYRTSLGMARGQSKRLRIRLRITPPELAALPWEYLYDGQEDAFLATSAETALVRYVPISLPVRPTTVTPPLRILVVIANPRDGQALAVDREKAIVQAALSEWVQRGRVQLEIVERAIAGEISQALRRFQPHVFHFIGHGLFAQERACLILEDEAGNATPVDERTFREFFNGCQETRLAVLNACQTATVSSSQPLVGLAPRLLQRQLSAVVAMQYPISDKTSLIFTREFYRSLALGAPVDVAISEARKGIFVESGGLSSDWGTPVLFLRAKDGLLFKVDDVEAKVLEIPAPPEPTRPPEMLGFVGRDAELSDFAEKLAATHLAVIAGMAGVGKTALATKLIEWVARDRDRVFWHSFHEGEGIDVILWRLAGFLAWHGRSDLWKLLQSARLTGGKPPPSEVLFDYLLQLSRGGNFLFCFDDFHQVDDDPVLNQLVERLRGALAAGDLSLILTSRRVPDFITVAEFNPLAGLSALDTRQLLLMRGLHLPEAQIDDLYKHTTGNAEFLTLAINALQQAKNPDLLISRLAESDDIERYLLQEVDETLTGQERGVMNAVAILLGYAGTRHAIEMVLNGGNVFRTLRRLTERHLLTARDGEAGREYLQHAIVQTFYYEQTNLRERRGLHRRAGAYYETEEIDLLRAGIHFARAGEYDHAAALATKDVWTIINRGQIRALQGLLEGVKAAQLPSERWVQVNLALGQLYALQAQQAHARDCYDAILAQLERQPTSTAKQLLMAQTCRGLGELLDRESPPEALTWLARGLSLVPAEAIQEKAALLIALGTVQMYLENDTDAQAALESGLALLPEPVSQLQAIALLNLTGLFFIQGNYALAQTYGLRALAICQQLYDQFRMAETLGNLGNIKFINGDWPGAIANYQRALDIATSVGYQKFQGFITTNLGIVHFHQGNHALAQQHLENGLRWARQNGDRQTEIIAKVYLADVQLRIGQYELARQILDETEEAALALEQRAWLSRLYDIYAELALANGNNADAHTYVTQAIKMAEALGDAELQGIALRILGQIYTAQGALAEAETSFRQSLDSLGDQALYQIACTKAQWGIALLTRLASEDGRPFIDQARQVFQMCGAYYDLDKLNQIQTANSKGEIHETSAS